LNVDGGLGLRQKELLAEDGGVSLAAYRQWETDRAATLERGAAPQYRVLISSQTTDAPPGDAIPVAVEFAVSQGRARGRRYGTLVHAVLRDVELDATSESIAALVEIAARSIGAPDEERDFARAAVEAALTHPLMHRARAASRCHREYPVMLKLDDGQLLDGVIDLAFVEDGAWNIVDFKTDISADSQLRDSYVRQLQWYGYALTRITGMSARGYLLGV